MLQLLTPTGGRPIQWALCQRWLQAQRYAGAVRWIVVDDAEPMQEIALSRPGWEIISVRPRPHWAPGQNTQARNLLAGIDVCDPAHPIVCWEDDDYYAPDWLETIARELKRAELVGEGQIHYYNVATRRWNLTRPTTHALSSTALRGGAIGALRQIAAAQSTLIDAALWARHTHSQHVFAGHRVVSIKGLPGRPGIGVGHRPTFGSQRDPTGQKLAELIGQDADAYRVFYGHVTVSVAA